MDKHAEPEHQTLIINHLEMHVLLAGTGHPLLLLHGFPDSAKLWRNLIPHLVDAGFQVIAPDQRGFGETTAPPKTSDYTIERIASDAIALLDALGIDRAALMAHDWGATIGWRLAAEHPDRFTGYVALSVGHPKAMMNAGLRQQLKSWYFALFLLRGFAEIVLSLFNFRLLSWLTHHEPEVANWRQDLSRPGRLTAGLNWYRANIIPMAKSEFPPARVPVLGIIGGRDLALTVKQMQDSQAYVMSAFQYEVLPDASHWMPVHSAAEISKVAIGFLK